MASCLAAGLLILFLVASTLLHNSTHQAVKPIPFFFIFLEMKFKAGKLFRLRLFRTGEPPVKSALRRSIQASVPLSKSSSIIFGVFTHLFQINMSIYPSLELFEHLSELRSILLSPTSLSEPSLSFLRVSASTFLQSTAHPCGIRRRSHFVFVPWVVEPCRFEI